MVDVIIPFKRTFGSTYNSWGTFLQVVTEKWLLFIIIWKIFVVTTIIVHGARHFTFLGITYKSLHFDSIFSVKLECDQVYIPCTYIRYPFLSNLNVSKRLCGLCFGDEDFNRYILVKTIGLPYRRKQHSAVLKSRKAFL